MSHDLDNLDAAFERRYSARMKLLGTKGGHARAAKLTAARRSASARKAVRARERKRVDARRALK